MKGGGIRQGPQGPQGPQGDPGVTGATGAANISGTTGKLVKFTASTTGGDSLASESGSVITLDGASVTTGRAQARTAQGGGWMDLVGPYVSRGSGATIPTLTTVGASVIQMPLWGIGDLSYWYWHVPHDYAIGTDVYFHVHYLADGSSTNTVRWQVTHYYAKGYGTAAFGFGGGGTVTTITQAPTGTPYTHMIAESSAVTIPNMEPDGFVCAEIKRITNGGADNADNIFAWQADIHIQSTERTTANRNGPWGT